MNSLTLITPPETAPVSLAEAKAMLKFDADLTADDAMISVFLKAAIATAENFLNRRLITQTWEMKRDAFPCETIRLPYGRSQSVASISYLDTAGVNQTWATDRYRVDTDNVPGRITPVYGEAYPPTHPVTNAVTVRFVCGYGDAPGDVPEEIRVAILLATRVWYDQRADGNLPKSAEMLLWPHRLVAF